MGDICKINGAEIEPVWCITGGSPWHIEALMKANDSLKDAIARRDKQIEDMKQGMAQLAKAVAVREEME